MCSARAADAGVVRIEGHPTKALAFSSDVTPRYCEADPYEGGKQAVAECWRNLIAVGAEPIAATDNLNFGNPERPEIMGQLVQAIKGIGEACRALDFPIVSGNVSLYNETDGRAIPPTPTIGGVGLLPDWQKMARIGFAGPGKLVCLVRPPTPIDWGRHLGQSLYLRDLFGRAEGPPPPVDLAHERRAGDFVRDLIRRGTATAVHDVSDGGIAVALAEMAMASGIGFILDDDLAGRTTADFFGEDQGRYLLTVEPVDRTALATLVEQSQERGVWLEPIGTTGGDALDLGADARPIPIAELRAAHEGWFPRYMAGETLA